MSQADANAKSLPVAYALLLLFGGLGAHRYYLQEKGTATALLLVTVLSVLLMTVAIGFFTIVVSIVWVAADLFRLPAMQRRCNASATGAGAAAG